MPSNSEYTKRFYDVITEGSLASAWAIIPLLEKVLPKSFNEMSVVDLGCGNGAWLSVFKELGCNNITGVDGGEVDETNLLIPKENFISHDFTKPFPSSLAKYDLAMSLECAEHFSNSHADGFVKTLTSLSNIVLFSAAIPEQGGVGHINCQWQSYWVDIFKKYGFCYIDMIRKQVWDNQSVAWWYSQNVMIYISNSIINDNLAKLHEVYSSTILDVVHPNFMKPFHILDLDEPTGTDNIETKVKMTHDNFENLPKVTSTISFVIVTRATHLKELKELMKSLLNLKDELVIILDNEDINVYNELSAIADKIICIPGKGCFEAYAGDMYVHCTKDWIFRIDDDETLSAISKDELNDLISNRDVTSYWIPRKWYVSEHKYIITPPWLPDYQMRLFRNITAIAELPKYIHQVHGVSGKTKYVNEFHLKHWDLSKNSRANREKKVDYYNILAPDNLCSMFYLFEDYPHCIVNELDAGTMNIDVETNSIFCNTITPKAMRIDLAYTLEVILNVPNEHLNDINRENTFISFHWFDDKREIYQWDYDRFEIPNKSAPRQVIFLTVQPPTNTGIHYLEVDIVEEGVRWFVNTNLMKSSLIPINVIT